jgi:predicted lactoylglutathione lyase
MNPLDNALKVHVALKVRDLEASISFYSACLA